MKSNNNLTKQRQSYMKLLKEEQMKYRMKAFLKFFSKILIASSKAHPSNSLD